MNATVRCYDEGRREGLSFSRTYPLPLLHSFYEFNRARRDGSVITFVAEGPDAERAMDVVRGMLEKPTNPVEAFLEMVVGRPVSFPQGNNPKPLGEVIDEKLRAWGLGTVADLEKTPAAADTKATVGGELLDVAADIDRLIERRASREPDPDELEPTYAESVRRYREKERREHLWQRLRFHERMLANHTRTFKRLV